MGQTEGEVITLKSENLHICGLRDGKPRVQDGSHIYSLDIPRELKVLLKQDDDITTAPLKMVQGIQIPSNDITCHATIFVTSIK